ncbi:hypothetical protein BJ508DRAFT_332145 [Ascobolus immersus RN42]|uniref:Uncharacterized protein n=1 Tax=Ascobolus immersus RN42 TaxID=1160509 RepID=A0A3N4HUE1_ASCIM|nr:hypothetical protein BJ508DRAFT_332145 [Ascobolus immersus RN42]
MDIPTSFSFSPYKPEPPHLLYTTHLSIFHEESASDNESFTSETSLLSSSDTMSLASDPLDESDFFNALTTTQAPLTDSTVEPIEEDDDADDQILIPGSVPWSQRFDLGVIHSTFYIPIRGTRKAKYHDLGRALGMPAIQAQSGGEFVSVIRNFLLECNNPVELFNDSALHDLAWYNPDHQPHPPLLKAGDPFCFNILEAKLPTQPLKTINPGPPSKQTPLKRARSNFETDPENEAQSAYAQTAGTVAVLQDRVADLELTLHGKVSTLADPNLPSSKAVATDPCVLDRLHTIDLNPVTGAKLVSELPPAEYTTIIKDIGNYICHMPDTPFDALKDQILKEADDRLTAKAEVAVQSKAVRQLIIRSLKEEIQGAAARAAKAAIDEYIVSEEFLTDLQPKIQHAANAIPLSLIEKGRLQEQATAYLRPRWTAFEAKMLTHKPPTSTPSSSSQQQQSPVATSPPPPPPPPPQPLATTPTSPDRPNQDRPSTNRDRDTRDRQQQFMQQQESNASKMKKLENARRVSAYLTALTGIPHTPAQTQIIKDLGGGNFIPIGPNIIASYLNLTEIWEKEQEARAQAAYQPPPQAYTAPPPPPPASQPQFIPNPHYQPPPPPPAAPVQYSTPAPPPPMPRYKAQPPSQYTPQPPSQYGPYVG